MRYLKLHSLWLAVPLFVMLMLSLLAPALSNTAGAADKSTITFINKSGVPALVKLVGPTKHTVEVGDGNSQTVQVAGGEYHILVRYGAAGKYRYSKGDPSASPKPKPNTKKSLSRCTPWRAGITTRSRVRQTSSAKDDLFICVYYFSENSNKEVSQCASL